MFGLTVCAFGRSTPDPPLIDARHCQINDFWRRRRRIRLTTLTMAEVGEAAVARLVADFMAERASGGGGGGSGGSGSGGHAAVGNNGGDVEASGDEVSGRGARARREDAQTRYAMLLKGRGPYCRCGAFWSDDKKKGR